MANTSPEKLIERARTGDEAALGGLLELYRNYLRLMARSLMGQGLRIRVDPSDLVQETFLEAHRDFARFEGEGERELVAWLRKILIRNLADQARHHQSRGRDHRRELSLQEQLERSSRIVQNELLSSLPSPSAAAARREQAVLLADALATLPPDYKEVIMLRNLEHLPFPQVASRMGRTAGAVRILWTRALTELSRAMERRS